MSNVLITGGTGLIGQYLSNLLVSKGYSVGHLTRSGQSKSDKIRAFKWNFEQGEIDQEAIPWADHIIHLAGETVGQRWTKKVKQKILQSRTKSTQLIIEELKNNRHHLKSFVSASAVGYYGDDTGDKLLTEESPQGEGFLSSVTGSWEEAVAESEDYTERLVTIRIGVVLSDKGGALAKMAMPIRWGVGSALGSGKQWLSWIHIDDLAKMFIQALEKPIHGMYNGVGPNPATNKEFTKTLAKHLHRPIILPPVPAFILKLMLGEMSVLALGSNKAEPVAFLQEGFTFGFANLDEALKSLM
jgi:uncharacterized protein